MTDQRDRRIDEAEVISLTVPHEQRFVNVVRIVVGGLAARLELPYESLDDLQLAVEAILSEERYIVAREVTVEITVRERNVCVLIGPISEAAVAADLENVDEGLGLGLLLSRVVDSVGFEERADERAWLRLEKQVPSLTAEA